jgi:hypothetical protein
LDLEFFLLQLGPTSADLDNLAKPILDALFAPRPNPNALAEVTGGLFEADDAMITRLTLRKSLASGPADVGVRIDASWTDEAPPVELR